MKSSGNNINYLSKYLISILTKNIASGRWGLYPWAPLSTLGDCYSSDHVKPLCER